MSAYTEHVSYKFKVSETVFFITDWSDDWLYVEEARKNSQEDSHMVGSIILSESGPQWEDEDVANFLFDELGPKILQFIKEHGHPAKAGR